MWEGYPTCFAAAESHSAGQTAVAPVTTGRVQVEEVRRKDPLDAWVAWALGCLGLSMREAPLEAVLAMPKLKRHLEIAMVESCSDMHVQHQGGVATLGLSLRGAPLEAVLAMRKLEIDLEIALVESCSDMDVQHRGGVRAQAAG